MSSSIRLFLAIYEQDPINHWALYFEKEGFSTGTAFHIRGGTGMWSLYIDATDPRGSRTFAELMPICSMPASKRGDVEDIAYDIAIPDENTWNCQDFVIALLQELGTSGAVDKDSDEFKQGLDAVKAKKDAAA